MSETIKNTLIVCDLDNALVNAKNEITQANRDIIRLFCLKGGKFSVMSERSVQSVQKALYGLPITAPIVCCGGSLVYDCIKQQAITSQSNDMDKISRMLDIVMERYPELGICIHTGTGKWNVIRGNLFLDTMRKSEKAGFTICSASDIKEKWLKVDFVAPGQILDDIMQSFQASQFGAEWNRSGSALLCLMPKGASKAYDLQVLASACEIAVSNTVVIGSGDKDIPVMKAGGYAACGANASPAVKLAADYISCISYGEGAVADFMYHWIKEHE